MNRTSPIRSDNLKVLIYREIPKLSKMLKARFLLDNEEINDALHKGLEKLWTLKPFLLDMKSVSKACKYVYVVAKNELIDRLQEKQLIIDFDFSSVPVKITEYSCDQEKDEAGNRVFFRKEMKKAILKLTQRRREILRLHIQERMTDAQIASELDISLGTVKSTLHQIRKLLKELKDQLKP